MSGKLQTKNLSKVFLTRANSLIFLEVISLMLLGAIAVTLKTRLKLHLGIPGHHGIDVMAILIAGKLFSMPSSSMPPKGGLVTMTLTRSLAP